MIGSSSSTRVVQPGGRLACLFGRCQRKQPRGAELQFLDVALVVQMFHADIAHGNVILRVVGDLPNVMRAGRVEYECPVEVAPYSPWGGLNEAAFAHHLGVVPVGTL
jgi:hypothetical protein